MNYSKIFFPAGAGEWNPCGCNPSGALILDGIRGEDGHKRFSKYKLHRLQP